MVTTEGDTYTLSELTSFLERAGFSRAAPACEAGTGLIVRADR